MYQQPYTKDDLRLEQHQQHHLATLDRITRDMLSQGVSEAATLIALTCFNTYLSPDLTTPSTATPPASQGHLYSTLSTTPLQWLLQDRIPLGHLTLLEGPSGSGTSLLALHLAAHHSNPTTKPDGTTPQSASTILIAPYAHPSSSTTPRLHAASANPAHILNLSSVQDLDTHTHIPTQRPFALPKDLPVLEAAITRISARLVILDPTSALLAPSAIRTVLPHLALLAQRTNCAILLIRPINPHPANHPLPTRSTCSPDLLAAVASALIALPDPEDPEQCLLISTKHSFTPQAPSTVLYQITTPQHGHPTITWLGEREPDAPVSPTSDLLSKERQQIIGLLSDHQTTTPLDAATLAHWTFRQPAAVRQMLRRMTEAGQLVSPAYGLYTTPNHPCLAHVPATPPVTPVTNDPSIITATPPVTPVTPDQTTFDQHTHQNPNPTPREAQASAYECDESRPAGGKPSRLAHEPHPTTATPPVTPVTNDSSITNRPPMSHPQNTL